MNILIVPDSMKGSLSASQFCEISAQVFQKQWPAAKIRSLPMADGGEGTIDALLSNLDGERISIQVQDALGKIIWAEYAILKETQTAIIEMAQASGLPLIEPEKRNPFTASSYGTGELILDALDRGCQTFIIGLGGSATNDGGTGMLQALGVKFFDASQNELDGCGSALNQIASIDCTSLDERFQKCDIIIAGDVTNPLLGENGATFVFGPQKGAGSADLIELDKGMAHYANKSIECCAIDSSLISMPGAGAAGGMGFALMAFFNARMQSGFELISDRLKLNELFEHPDTRPDIILTGEGQFDRQSLQGKLVGRLLERAGKYKIPLIIVCGSVGNDLSMEELPENVSVFSFCDGPVSLAIAMENAENLLNHLLNNLSKVIAITFSES